MPNILTTIRILSPVYFLLIIFLIEDFHYQGLLIFFTFIFLSITDFLDGILARKLNLSSDYGRIFDPVGDKILVSSALLYIITYHHTILYPAFLIVFREFVVSGVREFSLVTKSRSVNVSYISKIKTTLQFLAISGLLIDNNIKAYFNVEVFKLFNLLLWIATLLTLYTGFSYCYKTYRNQNKE
ncbi:MAG: CDP-diacylglycerol--glycerol-3-phosphate 3-phosphatidyltransferase [Rickettsiales bacterium]|nr:CDP-diacylglycerol--glycerol-3-phosphate 3-phosphatidyltransferase [Rickettsiales bacterium]|tara:strand:- start:291 stop:842 length:552 start_codon:yes stop_codon:yes gene_type:complete